MRLLLLPFLALVLAQDPYVVPDGYITTRIEDYWFEFHATHHLLLIVGKTCHIVHVDAVMERQLRVKDDREALEDDMYNNYVKPNLHEHAYTYSELRNEFHDLYANFQCIGKYVYKIDYVHPSMAPISSGTLDTTLDNGGPIG
ncbi:uncharacterized protein LOC124262813 [Haliotis rubra]|uniref:uncharacterized protein LOC124262813 n=1 Tax=Haliotis rubra TaxID=36100 RepID=UPI001EE5E9F9|nr:uncharacterized protein LOC124262813 [Haliotis rubra]